MQYFVTGATGFIGKRLVKTLIYETEKGLVAAPDDLAALRTDAVAALWMQRLTRAEP